MSDIPNIEVTVTMSDFIAEGLADILDREGESKGDAGWLDLADRLRGSGHAHSGEIRVVRKFVV